MLLAIDETKNVMVVVFLNIPNYRALFEPVSPSQQGFYTCLKLLVQRSSRPGLPDQDKVTPCHLATQRGNNKCLPLLLKHLNSDALNAEDCNKVEC